MAKRGKAKKRLLHSDPIFFPEIARPKKKHIFDSPSSELNPNRFSDHMGNIAKKMPDRVIMARGPNEGTHYSGVLIPVSHFKPKIDRLIKEGKLNPSNVEETVAKIEEMTNKLIPIHVNSAPPKYLKLIQEHGEYLAPLISIKEGKGACREWSAVFTAMARGAGLQVKIQGDPNFFKGLNSQKRAFHVWPVVTTSSGKKIIVHSPKTRENVKETIHDPGFKYMDNIVRREKFESYKEHVPEKPVIIPKDLKVNRPDVFGE